MKGVEVGYIHLRDRKVIGVRHHDSSIRAVLYEADLEGVLAHLAKEGWLRSDAGPIPVTGQLKIERTVESPPQESALTYGLWSVQLTAKEQWRNGSGEFSNSGK